ncbi:MAG: ParA family protein [Clostridiales bacterium]|nr:ParA family protein [Clostridiales bacterium]
MGKVIAIANQKGGVGKTTTAINLSACLAELGKEILLVDFDPQGNTSSGLNVRAEDDTVYEAVLGGVPMARCIFPTMLRHLHVVPSDIRLANAEPALVNAQEREFHLKKALAPVVNDYDYVFIDCPPSLGLLTVNALTAAQRLIVPIQCEYYALEGLSSLTYTIDLIKRRSNPGLDIEGMLLTMLDGRTNLGIQVVDTVKKHFRKKVYATAIPRNVRLGEAPSHGLPIHLYDPRSLGAESYRRLAKEFLRRDAS